MNTDILSSLNSSGSGLNISQVAGELAEAETAPRRNIIEDRIDDAETSISALGLVRAEIEALDQSLALASTARSTAVFSSNASVTATLNDVTAAELTDTQIEVVALALPQVLEFSGFAGPDAALDAGTITIETGVWFGEEIPQSFAQNPDNAPVTIEIAEGTTLQDLADQLSAVTGVTARVLDVGDGTVSLGVSSEFGVGNALRLTATPAGTPTGTGIDIAGFDTTTTNADKQVQAASDAMVLLNGIAVFRDSNSFDDVIDGVTLRLNEVSTNPATVSVTADGESAFVVLDALINQLNTTTSFVRDVTRRAYGGEAAGNLAGDPVADALGRRLNSLINGGLEGFGDAPVYLSDLGVQTLRDGSLSLNRTLFDEAFAANPALFDAIVTDRLRADSPDITVSGTITGGAPAGSYDFVRDPDTGYATLNGTEVIATPLDDGTIRYRAYSGDLAGVSITVPADTTAATITYGKSLTETMRDELDAILADNGMIGRRERALGDTITEDQASINDLNLQAIELEERYIRRFAEMERIITEMNSTGQYLTNLVNAWNADN
ncbi:MAG: flagellar filament capping protein FliD [Pseudomonadota bacterium]|jgi:flagellar hook-associated protein 2|nr:flagellar filament capping protein FliD [Pseudomonadota bacterium]